MSQSDFFSIVGLAPPKEARIATFMVVNESQGPSLFSLLGIKSADMKDQRIAL